MNNLLQDREYLIKRHRLSHRQIDNLLGETKSKEFIHTSMQSLEFIKHFIELIDLLKQHNISYINFKGPLLSQLIYGDPTVRFSHDIDILVDKNGRPVDMPAPTGNPAKPPGDVPSAATSGK